MGDLIKKVSEREETAKSLKEGNEKEKAVKKFKSSKGKDKPISAKVNSDQYSLFCKINEVRGISNNSAINMIINEYVRENKHLLEEI